MKVRRAVDSLLAYASPVTLDHQFYDDGTTSSSGGSQGTRVNVGTSVDGYHSYLIPMLQYSGGNERGRFKVAAGYGLWIARMSGDIILTPDNRPVSGMPTDPVDLNVKQRAYLVMMSYRTAGQWVWQMTVGGPTFKDDNYKYSVEEVTMSLGREFSL